MLGLLTYTLTALALSTSALARPAANHTLRYEDSLEFERKREAVISKLTPRAQAYVRSLPREAVRIDMHEVTPELQRRYNDGGDYTNCANGQYAMSFDDGPNQIHKQVADTMAKAGHHVTFFFTGNNYDCAFNDPYPEWMKHDLDDLNFQFGSHTWSHPHTPDLTDDEFWEQIGLMEDFFVRTIGVKPKAFRFPYGEFTEHQRDLLHGAGYYTVGWSNDWKDSDGLGPDASKALIDQVQAGDISLAHDPESDTANILLPYAIEQLKDKGLVSQTVHECLGLEGSPYSLVIDPQHREQRNDKWTCDGKPKFVA